MRFFSMLWVHFFVYSLTTAARATSQTDRTDTQLIYGWNSIMMVFNFSCNWKITLAIDLYAWQNLIMSQHHSSSHLLYLIIFYMVSIFQPYLMPERERERLENSVVDLCRWNRFWMAAVGIIWIEWNCNILNAPITLKMSYQLRLLIRCNLIIAEFRPSHANCSW